METMLIDWLHQLGTLEFVGGIVRRALEGRGAVGPYPAGDGGILFFRRCPSSPSSALNIAAHGGISWLRLQLARCGRRRHGGVLFWRRVVKRFFWKLASRSEQLKKAQQWVSHVDTATLFMLAVLPFTPTSFLHLAFGISDFDEKRYLLTLLAGKAVMVAMMALFGHVAGQRAENTGLSHPRHCHLGRDVLGEQEVL